MMNNEYVISCLLLDKAQLITERAYSKNNPHAYETLGLRIKELQSAIDILSSNDKVIASGEVEYIYHKDDVVALVIGGKLVDEALAFSIIEESGLQGEQVDLILRKRGK